jgi:hypothetical protein
VQPLHTTATGGDWRRGHSLAVLVSALWLTTADAHAQSLGDLAAREAARRAMMVTTSPAYTNMPRTDHDSADRPAPAAAAVPQAPPLTTQKAPALPVGPDTPATPAGVEKPVLVSHPAVIPDQERSETPAEAAVGPATRPAAAAAAGASAAQTSPSSAALEGWSTFQIKKTPAELTETARLADIAEVAVRTGPGDVRPPPQRDVLRLSTGLGYLQGADWGGDVSAFGKINGMQTDVTAFVTAGPMGFQSRSGHVSIFSPDRTWRGEGGDLYSDLRGLARGARVSWSAGPRWTPSMSLYLPPRDNLSNAATVFAYRDRIQLLPRVRVGGEVTSDGAAFLQGQYAQPRLDLNAFYRLTRGPIAGRDKGASAGLTLGRGVAVSGALRLSDAVGDSSRQWQLASVRLPLGHQASVTLERSWWGGSSDDGSTNAVTVQLPLGPVRVIQRLQWGRTDYRQRALPFGFDQRQSQSTASYTPGPWGSLYYQQSTQWFDDGRVQQWDEVSSMLQLGRRTTAQFVTAFPDISDPQRFRARVTQRLSPTLLLEAQYGRLSAFQMTRASEGEQSRVMVTIRKTWQVESPSRGGNVSGRAIDQAGYPVEGALVSLGAYTAITDAAGRYGFTRVPNGDFELALDRNKLPAAYAWDEKPRTVTVAGRSRTSIDLGVIPLNAIRGRVYVDGDGNGQFDEGEGVPNAVVAVDGAVTATSPTGAYAFYNQPPGRYIIRLDVKRLARGLAPVSPSELEVELTGQRPVGGVNFMLEKQDMPIIMKELPR